MPSSHICARQWLPVWVAFGALNIAAGLILVLDPDRSRDLETVRGWTRVWLFGGRDLYGSPIGSGTDYPPHAIVFLSPIALLPSAFVTPAWAACNIVFAMLAPVLAWRFVRPTAEARRSLCLVALFLCWSGTRTLLQFTMATLVFGLLALVTAPRRPFSSGIFLAVALMKPQIGAPFLLWILFTRRWRVATVAALAVLCGTLVWCARAGTNPADTLRHYIGILAFYYTGEQSLAGIAQLRPAIAQFAPGSGADIIAAMLSAGLLAAICIEGFRWGPEQRVRLYPAPALAAIWSLLTFYHLTYGFVLLLPAMSLLLLDGRVPYRARMATAWTLQLVMMVDLPGLVRRIEFLPPGLDSVGLHFYRFALPVILAAMWFLHRRDVRSSARSA